MNSVVVFVLSAAFIAYAPDYIGKINEFSADINASLSLGTKIVLPNSESQGKDSVDLIRDSLFSIQVKQPWLLLQYGNSDVESIGADRVESLLSTSPNERGETMKLRHLFFACSGVRDDFLPVLLVVIVFLDEEDGFFCSTSHTITACFKEAIC